MTAPIVAEHLTKIFGSKRGITDVNLMIEPGQVFGFLGPNGAGKSTTIRCLLGLYRPTSGLVRVFGQDPTRSTSFLADVGYLPGELRLPEMLTGADLLRRFARFRRLSDIAYGRELVARLGAELGRPVRDLSKGNKQKIGIVLAFMHRPRLLVLDEPTSGLDPLLQDEFVTVLWEAVSAGCTVLISSHDLDEVQRVADHVGIIRSGHIVLDDTVQALLDAAPRTIDATFGHDIDLTTFDRMPGVTVDRASPRHVILTHVGSVAPLLTVLARLEPDTITARPAELDELFLRVYREDVHVG